MTIRLNDLQLMLLSTASQHKAGSLIPLHESITDQPARTDKAIEQLITKGLVEPKPGATRAATWREEGDVRIGAVITDTGRAAIGVVDDAVANSDAPAAAETPAPVTETPRQTKRDQLIDLLKREGGASLDQMVAALGWLPHTTRAAMTGLRKAGMTVDSEKVDGTRRYRITEAG